MCVVCARSYRQRKYGSFIEYLREKDPRIREKVILRNDPVFFLLEFPYENDHLPRQARDKLQENSTTQATFANRR